MVEIAPNKPSKRDNNTWALVTSFRIIAHVLLPLLGALCTLNKEVLNMNNPTKPKLFIYSLILPTIWLGNGAIFRQFFPDKNLGVMGLVLILYIALLPISWHFAKHYGRQFIKHEKVRLIGYLTFWTVSLESLGLLYHVNQQNSSGFDMSVLLGIIGFTFLVDLVFVFLGVQFICKRYIQYFLGKREIASA